MSLATTEGNVIDPAACDLIGFRPNREKKMQTPLKNEKFVLATFHGTIRYHAERHEAANKDRRGKSRPAGAGRVPVPD